jgi:hypothetical protein
MPDVQVKTATITFGGGVSDDLPGYRRSMSIHNIILPE